MGFHCLWLTGCYVCRTFALKFERSGYTVIFGVHSDVVSAEDSGLEVSWLYSNIPLTVAQRTRLGTKVRVNRRWQHWTTDGNSPQPQVIMMNGQVF
jgi:hypothetical protein